MSESSKTQWSRDHTFGQDQPLPGEKRTLTVIALTATTMVVEIAAGLLFGSMALLADGLHMASHTAALTIAAFAYAYARRHAGDETFSFGTGKVNSLAGFAGALLLGVFALLMAWESVDRFFNPVAIAFNQAIIVAVAGLVVNGASVWILGGRDHGPEHRHRGDDVEDVEHARSDGSRRSSPEIGPSGEDHNLRSAYLHVLADTLTSVLAILALLAGKLFGQGWMDPAMGIVGAVLVANWSLGLARRTGRVLLDHQGPEEIQRAIRESIEGRDGNRVIDLHVWCIGPGIFAAVVSLVTDEPRTADHYKDLLPHGLGVVHVTVEVHHTGHPQASRQRRTSAS